MIALLLILASILIIGITASLVFLSKALYHYSKYLLLKKENKEIHFIKYQPDKIAQKDDNTYISLN